MKRYHFDTAPKKHIFFKYLTFEMDCLLLNCYTQMQICGQDVICVRLINYACNVAPLKQDDNNIPLISYKDFGYKDRIVH